MPELIEGDICTLDSLLVCVLAVNGDECVVQNVAGKDLSGPPYSATSSELKRAFVPAEQARRVYAARTGLDYETFSHAIPALPVGTREYHEYRQQIRAELRKSRLWILGTAGPDSYEYRQAEEFLNTYPAEI